jgi:hypothetical protein
VGRAAHPSFAVAAIGDRARPATAAALVRIRQEVEYVEHTALPSMGQSYPHAYVFALATMSYVVGHVSAPAYGYLDENNQPLPGGDDRSALAEASLAAGAGICGNAACTMLALLSEEGIRTRLLSLYFQTQRVPRNGHNVVEVYYDRRWHLFDPTWGRMYRRSDARPPDVLSAMAVLKMSAQERAACAIPNGTLLWSQIVSQSDSDKVETGYDVFDLPHVRLVIDRKTVYSR